MQYCIAAALIDGRVNLATFDEEHIRREALVNFIPKVKVEVDERVRDHSEFASYVTVTMKDGRQHERFIPYQAGKAERWLTPEQLSEKFLSCTANNGSRAWATSLLKVLNTIDTDAPVNGIIQALKSETPVVAIAD